MNSIAFEHEPKPNILLGSSQTGLLTQELIRSVSDKVFINMSYGGGTLPELMINFLGTGEIFRFKGSLYRNQLY